MLKIHIICNNSAIESKAAEHGLALLIEYGRNTFIFDGGNGSTLKANLPPDFLPKIEFAILSHGHWDHGTGLADLPEDLKIYHVPGAEVPRFSFHDSDGRFHKISLPEKTVQLLAHSGEKVSSPLEIRPGIRLTGPIPRTSGEDCGGKFFLDDTGKVCDHIADEQSLLLDCGVLVTGCGHAGIINTLEFCRRQSRCGIHTIAGGLHLVNASKDRLHRTAKYLRQQQVKNLILLHCTGTDAADELKRLLPGCRVCTPGAGESIIFDGSTFTIQPT